MFLEETGIDFDTGKKILPPPERISLQKGRCGHSAFWTVEMSISGTTSITDVNIV